LSWNLTQTLQIDSFSWYKENYSLTFSIHKVILTCLRGPFFPDTVYIQRWKVHLMVFTIPMLRLRVYLQFFIRLAVVGSQIYEITRNSERIRTVQSHPRSSVLVSINRKRTCDFLSVINSNFWHTSTVFYILTLKARKWLVFPPMLCLLSSLGGVRISGWNLPRKNYGDGTTVRWKCHNPNFNCFWLIHPCDGRTHRRTDRWAIAYTLWVKKTPPTVFWNFFANGWEFLINFYTLCTLNYKFLFKYLQLWQSYAILSATT